MTAWWTRSGRGDVALTDGEGVDARVPVVLPDDGEAAVRASLERAPHFAPAWTHRTDDDPGVVLLRLFGEQLDAVRERANRLPEKMLVELLRTAGVEGVGATAGEVLLELTLSPAAGRAVPVPAGLAVAANAADGSGGRVLFETTRSVSVFAGKVAEVHVESGAVHDVSAANEGVDETFHALGRSPEPGAAIWIGLDAASAPGPTVSLGVATAAPTGTPGPVSAGGLDGQASRPSYTIEWAALDGSRWIPATVRLDETNALSTTGVIELALPERFRAARPARLGPGKPRRWIRALLVRGAPPQPPVLRFIRANTVRAVQARSVRGEVPAAVPGSDRRRLVLSQTPVLAGSLVLRVDDGRQARVWRQVESLAGSMPDDEVYTLDATSGEITFGNGVEGALPPEGFRNIVAERYQVGGGRAGAIGSDAAKRLVGSAPYLTGVNNPLPAVGAADAEPRARTMLRGPEYIRTRDRAVTPADYALMALAAGGIARALAAPGRHPDFPGAFLPGVVTVYVIPSERTAGGPPMASEETLRRVARHLVREVAPAGVEVVAANPRYQVVRIETSLVARSSAVPGELAASAALALDRFLDPVDGGTAHRGWPLGPSLAHSELSAVLQNVPGVASVARLAVHLDELRARGCGDHPLHAWTLPWPGAHSVDVEAEVEP